MFAISWYSSGLLPSAVAAASIDFETLQAGIFLRLDAMQDAVDQDRPQAVQVEMAAIAALLPRDLDFEAGSAGDFLKHFGQWIGALRQFTSHYVGGGLDAEAAREHFRLLRAAFPEIHERDVPDEAEVQLDVDEEAFAEVARAGAEGLRELTAGEPVAPDEVTVGEPGLAVWDLNVADLGEELGEDDVETAAQHLSGRVYRHLNPEPPGSILIIDLNLPRQVFEALAFGLWRHLKSGGLRPFTGKSLIVCSRALGREARIEVNTTGKPYLNITWGSIR